jgi:hypothetical protein
MKLPILGLGLLGEVLLETPPTRPPAQYSRPDVDTEEKLAKYLRDQATFIDLYAGLYFDTVH